MIPICLKPKRFPCALGNARKHSGRHCTTTVIPQLCTLPSQRQATRDWTKAASLMTVRHTSFTNPVNASSTSTTLLHDMKSFSTASKMQPSSESEEFNVSSTIEKIHSSVVNVKIPSYISVHPKDCLNINLHGPREDRWYTGPIPVYGKCPGVEEDGRIYSLPQLTFQPRLTGSTRAAEATRIRTSLQNYFDNTWALTEVLLASLQGEETFMRPPYHDLRHPMIFYYGHPAALYVNKLRVAGLLDKPINAYFEVIFETGVDEMSWDDLSKNQMAWPSVAEVHKYREEVYHTVSNLIQNFTEEQCLTIGPSSPLWALVLGFEHERIHLETSSFLISELPLECVRFPEGMPSYHPSARVCARYDGNHPQTACVKTPVTGVDYPVNNMIQVPETVIKMGKPRDFPSFGWDNEYGQRTFTVPSFKASQFKVSNGEFLEFMQDGGYARNELWTAAGWEWRAFRNVKMPTQFIRVGPQGAHEYVLRLVFDETESVPWDWPVVVNLHEATAFAKWKTLKTGKTHRVLTELEHRAIRDHTQNQGWGQEGSAGGGGGVAASLLTDEHVATIGGFDMMKKAGYNTNLSCSSMSPVNALPPNKKGFYDVFGNAWEWTEDFFCALPGFQVHPYYEDFSTPCFDGLHHVIQGGSFISTGNECSIHSRFHFRPHFYQHASFRVVETDEVDQPLTSDTDAPGPYVGAYPFRRTQKSAQELVVRANIDKIENARNSILLKHFSASPLLQNNQSVMNDFAQRIYDQATQAHVNLHSARIIEVGCGPGGLTLSLAALCGGNASLIGIDHNAQYTEIARKLQKGEAVQAVLSGEGETQSVVSIASPRSSNPATATSDSATKSMVQFRTADPMCLPAELLDFDIVVLHDVIDGLASPNALLGRVGGVRGLVRKGGLLVLSSAYQWSEDRTPKGLWLGGYKAADGSVVSSQETLVHRLSEDFTLVRSEPLQQVWRESDCELRGSEHTVSYFLRK